MKIILLISILAFVAPNVNGQKKLNALLDNEYFKWKSDAIGSELFLYTERDSYPEEYESILINKIHYHIKSTCEFIGIKEYDKDIHYFVVESRNKMSLLLGYETNGGANYKENYVTAIYSENINSVFSNHELFHLMAMNLWGKTEAWINEGMAVYSDKNWHGHDLHEISKYLIDHNNYIPLKSMSKRLRKYDSMFTYPLLGSFTRFIDDKYGRETIMLIWKGGKKDIKGLIGKNLNELELEWLDMLTSVTYMDIEYLE